MRRHNNLVLMKFLTCNFHTLSEPEATALIRGKLEARAPFSFIRLGDGEGLLLSLTDKSPDSDFDYFIGHFGEAARDRPLVFELRALLRDAIHQADLLGIRDDILDVEFDASNFSLSQEQFLEQFRTSFKLRSTERSLGYEGARRIAALHEAVGRLEMGAQAYCSAWLHYSLHTSGALIRILASQERIGIISCRAELPERLNRLLGLRVKFFHIPDMYRDIPPGEVPSDYVARLCDPLQDQLVDCPGMLFLVGAGLFGKAYCQLIKSQGGIALDLGSLLDAWVGIGSRPTVFGAMFPDEAVENGVPASLVLNEQNVRALHAGP